ncbi:hypothetical protein [Streptomyces sp. RK31]|uniref:hypothetical protein n=1 Tax=Streptomyces sp. RK31 TaxID=2824892 RepID=UPI001FFCAB98|nr:hypothetical protein [Streptomyces sp. RK31]
MLGITGLMSGADRPAERVSALLSALPPGSYLPAERRHGHQRGTEPAVEAYHQQSAQTHPLRRRRKSPRGSPGPIR